MYQHHQIHVANGNHLTSPGRKDIRFDQFGSHHSGGGAGFNPSYHPRTPNHPEQQQGDRTRYNLPSVGSYHANHTPQDPYSGRPDSRGGGSYHSSSERLTMGYSSRNQQLMDAHAGLPSAHLGASLGALTRLPASATPSSPAANQEEGRREADLKHRSRSFGRSSSGQEPGVCVGGGVWLCVRGCAWVGGCGYMCRPFYSI